MAFPSDCRHGLKYYANTLSPDISTILTDLQAYGAGYCSTSSTDATGLHVRWIRPAGQPLQYPQSVNIFGTLDFNTDFEASFQIKFVSIDYAFGFCYFSLKCASVLTNLEIIAKVGYSYNSGIELLATPYNQNQWLTYMSNGSWYTIRMRKVGNRLWAMINNSPVFSLAWPGFSSTNGTVNVTVGTTSTSVLSFAYDIRNLRVSTLTGTSCTGFVDDLTKM